MKKTFSVRFLAGFLAFLMMFSYMPDLSVKAANNTSDVLVESADDTTDVASDVETYDVEVTDEKNVYEKAENNPKISFNAASYSWTFNDGTGENIFASYDESTETITFKDCSGLTYVPGNLSDYTSHVVTKEIEKEDGTTEFVELTEYYVSRTGIKCIKFEDGTRYETISEGAFAGTYGYKEVKDNNTGEITFVLKGLEEVDLSNCTNLTTIATGAFQGCIFLKDIKLPESLQAIHKDAFSGCALTEVVIPRDLYILNEGAFSNNLIKKVVLNTSNVNCEPGIFERNNISSIEFAESINEIPSNIFNSAGFASGPINISDTVTKIGASAFEGSNIGAINLDISKSKLQVIATDAFLKCTSLRRFPIPNDIAIIESGAFKECSSLDDIIFPRKYIEMGEYVFSASGLTKIVIPRELKKVCVGTFAECSKLTDITIEGDSESLPGIESLGASSFAACPMKSITIPDSVLTMGSSAFEACSELETVYLPTKITELASRIFCECTKLKNLFTIENLDYLRIIGESAFLGCISLTEINLPDNLIEIQGTAFNSCTGLEKIKFSKRLEIIGDGAFGACSSLVNVVFPESLLKIGNSAFEECKNIVKISIPKNVTYIGERAFVTNTTETGSHMNEVEILSNVIDDCGYSVFENAYLKSIIFGKEVKNIPARLFSNARFNTDFSTFYIPKRVQSIGDEAFLNTSIKEFKFGDGPEDDSTLPIELRVIGAGAFKNCSAITEFNIPESVTDIGNIAFQSCIKLTEVVIPQNVVSIGEGAFSNNILVENVVYNAKRVATSNDKIFDGCIVRSVTIGDMVEVLPANLFKGLNIQNKSDDNPELDTFVTLIIPASVERIGDSCFEEINNLAEVKYLGENSLTYVGSKAFYKCENMTTNVLPQSVKTIGDSAFDGCIKLSECNIPEELVSLGIRAYAKTLIKEAIIPNDVSIINAETFKECHSLVTVSFNGTGVDSIEQGAFEDCNSLIGGKNGCFDLPNNLRFIRSAAFKNCTSMKQILVPPSIEEIEPDAFAGCDFTKVYVMDETSYAYKYFNDLHMINRENLEYLNEIEYIFNDSEETPVDEFSGVKYYRNGDNIVFDLPSRFGYKFDGWFEDEACTKPLPNTYGRTGDIKVYAAWTSVVVYSITYDLDGGVNNKNNPGYINYGDTVELSEPYKAGYRFAGWQYEDGNSVYGNKLVNVTGDIKLKAIWEIETYYIVYTIDDSSYNVGYNVEQLPLQLDSPEKEGYEFRGWKRVFSDNTLSEEKITILENVHEDIVLQAVFEEQMYKITYVLDGGENSVNNPKTTGYRGYVTLENPTKLGYTFLGWRLNDETEFVFENKLNDIMSDITLTAVWKINTYYITYLDEGLSVHNNNPRTITIEDEYILTPPERLGYEFDKWVLVDGKEETEIKELKHISSNITIKAKWKIKTFKITYIIDEEGVENDKDNPTEIAVDQVVRLVPLEKEGYVFEGWFLVGKDVNGEEMLTPVTVLKDIVTDITLKAKFKLAIYNIEYILDGGVNNKDNPLTIGYKEEVVLKDATRDGYTFAGWCKRVIVDGNVIDTPITKLSKIDSDITLVAKWKETQYNITYILDGGTNSEKNPTTITVLDEVKLEDAKRDYSDFAGWVLVTVDADGNEKETPVTELKNVISDITLKALWKPFEYTIKFDLNGGRADSRHEEELADKKITSEDVVTLPCADSAKCVLSKKVSYALAGWSTEQYGKGEIYTCEQQVSKLCKTKDEVITLYAVWKDDYYFIQYNVNGKGATLSPQVDAKVVASLTVPRKLHSADDITRKGYIFKGWNTKKNGKGASYAPGEAVTGIGKVKKTIKLYAQWEAITYHITYETNDGILPTTAKDTFTAAKSYTLKKPKRDGYKFAGWYRTPDCRGVKVKKTAGIFEDITLYAKWEPK